jgi:hypothetical protein
VTPPESVHPGPPARPVLRAQMAPAWPWRQSGEGGVYTRIVAGVCRTPREGVWCPLARSLRVLLGSGFPHLEVVGLCEQQEGSRGEGEHAMHGWAQKTQARRPAGEG